MYFMNRLFDRGRFFYMCVLYVGIIHKNNCIKKHQTAVFVDTFVPFKISYFITPIKIPTNENIRN